MANEIEKITVDGTTYTIQDANAVPNTRKINNTALSSDITLSGNDILLTGYTQGSDTSAVAYTDKVNEAIAKHENNIALCKTNILYTQDMICDTEFSTSTAYAVGDIVTYNNSLYEFTSAHSAGAWNSADVTQIDVVGIIGNINTVLEGVL